jgi:hypothetical protein
MYRVACNEYRDLWGQVSRTIEQISGGVVIAAAAAAAAADVLLSSCHSRQKIESGEWKSLAWF